MLWTSTEAVPWQDQDCSLGHAGTMFYVYRLFSRYAWIPSVALGIPGNIMIMLIARRDQNRHLSPSVYMLAMSIVDCLLLVDTACFLPTYYAKLVKEERGAQYIYAFYVIHTCGTLSGFYLVAISVDRLVAVRYPMLVSRLCTPGRAWKAVATITVVIVPSYLTIFMFSLHYFKDESTGIENLAVTVVGDVQASQSATWFLLLSGTIIPFVIIFYCNLSIILTLKKAVKTREELTSNKLQEKTTDSSHLTRMLIFVSVTYLVVSVPYRIFQVVLNIPQVQAVYNLNSICFFVHYNMTTSVFYAIWCLNPALNFYLYCVGGGKRYRRDIKYVLRHFTTCCKCEMMNGQSIKSF